MFNMNIARFTYPIWWIFILTSVGLSNCRYDNKHDLYGNPNACDTSAVTFSQDIKMIIGQNCERCHNGAFAIGGLNLVGHENISTSALSGAIMDRVTRGAGDPLLMPPGEALSDCDQSKLRAWINEDAPNN